MGYIISAIQVLIIVILALIWTYLSSGVTMPEATTWLGVVTIILNQNMESEDS